MKCAIEGCESRAVKRGWCEKHYRRWYDHGNAGKRSRYEICRMKIYNRAGKTISETIFDLEDLPKVKGRKWGLDGRGYVRSGAIGPKIHQVILGIKGIDHKDRDKMNNRKSNLRVCSHSENLCNAKKRKDNISGFRGVCWASNENKWKAQIAFKKKHYSLGYFVNIVEAAKAYNKAATRLHGEFANINPLMKEVIDAS